MSLLFIHTLLFTRIIHVNFLVTESGGEWSLPDRDGIRSCLIHIPYRNYVNMWTPRTAMSI